MRNIKHHALIITCNDLKVTETIRSKALEFYKLNMEASHSDKLISPIMESLINHYYTFTLIPDGSKEGYDASDDNDVIRNKMVEFLTPLTTSTEYHLSFVEIEFGADDNKKAILN